MREFNELKTRKNLIIAVVLMIVAEMLLCVFMWWHEIRMKEIDISGIQRLTREEGVEFGVETAQMTVDNDGCHVNIYGWMYIHGRQTLNHSVYCLITDVKTNKTYRLPTAMLKREDVTVYFNEGINYDYAGYNAKRYIRGMEPEESRYLVLLLYEYDGEQYIVETDTYLKG